MLSSRASPRRFADETHVVLLALWRFQIHKSDVLLTPSWGRVVLLNGPLSLSPIPATVAGAGATGTLQRVFGRLAVIRFHAERESQNRADDSRKNTSCANYPARSGRNVCTGFLQSILSSI